MESDLVAVTCPTCYRTFQVSPPELNELPAEVDYDCEICCGPMMIHFDRDALDEVVAEAHGLSE